MTAAANKITLDSRNVGSFLGPIASHYSYTSELREYLDELYSAAHRSANRWFVLDGMTVRAAQSTEAGALPYMQDGCVLVSVEVLEPSQGQLEQAAQQWSYRPYRKCFIAIKAGEEMQIILKPTAHYAGKLAREGWTVRELHRG